MRQLNSDRHAGVLVADPHLRSALSVMLPSADQTCLLRACLLPGAAGREAWDEWQSRVGDARTVLERDQSGLKGLLTLIHEGLRHNGVALNQSLLDYLRIARLREDLRGNIVREICGQVIGSLANEGISVIALGGTALSETVYEDPATRHCHGIDLLVGEEDIAAVIEPISRLGLKRAGQLGGRTQQGVVFHHRSGLPITLHRRLFQRPHYTAPLDKIRSRAQPGMIAGAPARVLSPADNLMYVCGRAAESSQRTNLHWVSDAVRIVDRHPDLDWSVLTRTTIESRLALPLSITLEYLAGKLGAPVPKPVLTDLSREAARTDMAGYETALFGALTGFRSAGTVLFERKRPWRTRLRLLRVLLLPSPEYLRWKYDVRRTWQLPFGYLYHPLDQIRTRLPWPTTRGRLGSSWSTLRKSWN